MRRPVTIAVGVIVLVALGLSGCSDDEPGQARPAETKTNPASGTPTAPEPPSSTGAGDELPSNGAPAVTDPIDTSTYEQQPCRMLTKAQADQVGVAHPGEPGEGAVAPSCTWRDPDSWARVNIQYDTVTGRGLSSVYAAHEFDPYPFWKELPAIDGYPAVAASLGDDREDGKCTIAVGTSDEVSFQLAATVSDDKVGEVDPCAAASQVAALTLETMKEGE